MPSREYFVAKLKVTKVEVELVSMTSIREQQIDIVDEESDPYNVVRRKVEMAMELLGYDEAEAERFVLYNCK